MLVVFFPLLFVLDGFFVGSNDNVKHIQEYLLLDLIFTTIRMIFGVGLVSVILGLPTAYFVANYNFPLRNFLRKASLLPIAIPTYIMGFAYASIFSIGGGFYVFLDNFFSKEVLYALNIDVLNEFYLILFLGFALYPYVYSAALVSFSIKNKKLDEVAASLGISKWRRFWSVSFPLVFPALLSGVALVSMEVINDYGAMSYFNVNTITAGIFQAKQMGFESSVYLSAITFVVIVSFFVLYYILKSFKKVKKAVNSSNYELYAINGKRKYIVTFLVLLPFILGFVFPVAELLRLAASRIDVVFSNDFLYTLLDSVQLAIIPAVIIVCFSLVLLYNQYLNPGVFANGFNAFSSLGYAIPGAIIAMAAMSFVMFFDNEAKSIYHWSIDSLLLLIFAYVIRFMAVGFNTLDGAFSQISTSLPDASRSLGLGSIKSFFKVYNPLLKGAVLTTFTLVTIDILKELPITLLLQRFNFKTLATVAFEKAKVSESVRDASPYALLLIFVGVMAVVFLMKGENKKVKKHV